VGSWQSQSANIGRNCTIIIMLGWVTALSDIPIQGKMLIAAVGPRRGVVSHREEMIYMCTCSEKVRILQLIISGTLANAGRPERVKNKNKKPNMVFLGGICFCHRRICLEMTRQVTKTRCHLS
jgi:hypothetical protein